ncbi:MAG TPA: hypothetical protein VHA56_00325 [Mucilaginibacter sp.]|nr:hypothetical protein [Mucilaginibacter sp.]
MKTRTPNPRLMALAERTAARILHRQRRLAATLNRKTQHWNRSSKLIALTLLVLLMGGASLLLIIHALTHF